MRSPLGSPVLGQPSATPEPGEGPLHDPALGQGHEARAVAPGTISSRQRPVPATALAVPRPGRRRRRRSPDDGQPRRRAGGQAPSRSWTLAGWIAALSRRPSVSTRMCRFLPLTFLPHRTLRIDARAPFSASSRSGCRRSRPSGSRPYRPARGPHDRAECSRLSVPSQAPASGSRAPCLGRQILGQGPPLAARGRPWDAVQHLAHVHLRLRPPRWRAG